MEFVYLVLKLNKEIKADSRMPHKLGSLGAGFRNTDQYELLLSTEKWPGRRGDRVCGNARGVFCPRMWVDQRYHYRIISSLDTKTHTFPMGHL